MERLAVYDSEKIFNTRIDKTVLAPGIVALFSNPDLKVSTAMLIACDSCDASCLSCQETCDCFDSGGCISSD
ncbi:MAG: hypothetical protein Q7R97_00580 [Candidatus Daviesbacteria bacterium]|nr:hypothetical protein [Candidatus Daviesbacteria bacterium]